MKSDDNRARDIAEFERTLDVFGADQARWPVARREAFRQLVETTERARALLGEARALDRVLDRARCTAGAAQQDALAARILAAAVASPHDRSAPAARASATVIRLPVRDTGAVPARPTARFRDLWQAAAVLIAALLVGVLAGTSSNMNSVVQDMASSVGFPVEMETTIVTWQDASLAFDEDTL